MVEEFYGNLYASRSTEHKETSDDSQLKYLNSDDLPPILYSEIEKALHQMKRDKSPGQDGITIELLRAGGKPVLQVLVKLFNDVMLKKQTPESWKKAIVTIIHKKRHTHNYRPISLLSQIYKLFAKVLCNRLTRQLDDCQPI